MRGDLVVMFMRYELLNVTELLVRILAKISPLQLISPKFLHFIVMVVASSEMQDKVAMALLI